MDACVREGNWLNLSIPWESEVEELQPCYQNIQPGSYFPGNGFAIFNTSGGNIVLSYTRDWQVLTLLLFNDAGSWPVRCILETGGIGVISFIFNLIESGLACSVLLDM